MNRLISENKKRLIEHLLSKLESSRIDYANGERLMQKIHADIEETKDALTELNVDFPAEHVPAFEFEEVIKK